MILHCSQVAIVPRTHLWKNFQILVLGIFIFQGTVAWWRVLPGPQERRCHCSGIRGIAYQKFAMSLMPPCPVWGLNSLIFPCPILDKISRTSSPFLWHPPPPCTSKIVTGLLPRDSLILHTLSRSGKDLTYHMVRFDVLPYGLQFCVYDLPTSSGTPPLSSMPSNWCCRMFPYPVGSQCREQAEGGRQTSNGIGY